MINLQPYLCALLCCAEVATPEVLHMTLTLQRKAIANGIYADVVQYIIALQQPQQQAVGAQPQQLQMPLQQQAVGVQPQQMQMPLQQQAVGVLANAQGVHANAAHANAAADPAWEQPGNAFMPDELFADAEMMAMLAADAGGWPQQQMAANVQGGAAAELQFNNDEIMAILNQAAANAGGWPQQQQMAANVQGGATAEPADLLGGDDLLGNLDIDMLGNLDIDLLGDLDIDGLPDLL